MSYLSPQNQGEAISPRLFAFSLAVTEGHFISDDMICDVLGPAQLPWFRLVERKVGGRVRRTGEPVLAHPVDVALRALSLGFGDAILSCALLHDHVEDCSQDLRVGAELLDLVERGGRDRLAHDLHRLTNIYGIILSSSLALPEGASGVAGIVDAVRAMQAALPWNISQRFGLEFHQLCEYLLPEISSRVSPGLGLDGLLRMVRDEAYQVYIGDLADHVSRSGRPTVLVVKYLDLVDNLRTSSLANKESVRRILHKAERVLDQTYWLVNRPPSYLPLLYDYAKCHLIQILEQHRAAIRQLPDTRYVVMDRFYLEETNRMRSKYKVDNAAGTVADLASRIREANKTASQE